MKKYGMILAAITAAAMLAVSGCGNASSAPTQAAPAETKMEAAKEESSEAAAAEEKKEEAAEGGFEFKEPVNVIVPFKAGGTSDQQIRIMQPYLEKELGTTLVIINSDGGSGVLGTTEYLNNYKPDGYSILYTLATPVVYKPLTGDTSYTWADLQAVSKTMSLPMYLILSNESQFQSGEEIIEYIKANPGKFSYANVGNGGNGHLAFASFLAGTREFPLICYNTLVLGRLIAEETDVDVLAILTKGVGVLLKQQPAEAVVGVDQLFLVVADAASGTEAIYNLSCLVFGDRIQSQ